MQEIMIIAPHPDDEVYGCASFLKPSDEKILIVYVTQLHPLFPKGENIEEQKKLTEVVQLTPIFMNPHHDMTNVLDKLGQMDLINEFERIVNEYKPDTVLIPSPSYNQDHRAVYDAALTAMRPHDRNHFVKCILIYEEPDTFGTLRKPDAFRPTYYKELDWEFKMRLMSIYESQLRGHRSSIDVESIARVRGMQANLPHAEAFEILRWVE